MKALLIGVLAVVIAACGPRQVEVRTGQTAQSEVSLYVTNNLNQTVNVWVDYAGNEILAGDVAGGAAEQLPLPNIPSGASVVIRARTQDGRQQYCANRCAPVVLTGRYNYQVP